MPVMRLGSSLARGVTAVIAAVAAVAAGVDVDKPGMGLGCAIIDRSLSPCPTVVVGHYYNG